MVCCYIDGDSQCFFFVSAHLAWMLVLSGGGVMAGMAEDLSALSWCNRLGVKQDSNLRLLIKQRKYGHGQSYSKS